MSVVSDAVVDAALDAADKTSKQAVAHTVSTSTSSSGSGPTSWMTSVFRWTSYIFVFWIVLLIVYIIFSVYATWMFNSKTKAQNDSLEVKDLKKPNFDAVVFDPKDTSNFSVKKTDESSVTTLESDRTVFDVMQGQYGPAVVLFYGDWCIHCKLMMEAYEQAAKESAVPFVKIEGKFSKQTLKHFKVEGFPTIYGVDPERRVFPFLSERTKEALLAFAKKMAPESSETQKNVPSDDSPVKSDPQTTTVDTAVATEILPAHTVEVRVEVLDDAPQDKSETVHNE